MAEKKNYYDPNDTSTWMWRTEYGYPNGSTPYYRLPDLPYPTPCGYARESLALRLKRFVCAALNHHPRSYTGSWCSGYGYVCGRCYMYADPIPKAQYEKICEAINEREQRGERFYPGSYFGGGPPSERIS